MTFSQICPYIICSKIYYRFFFRLTNTKYHESIHAPWKRKSNHFFLIWMIKWMCLHSILIFETLTLILKSFGPLRHTSCFHCYNLKAIRKIYRYIIITIGCVFYIKCITDQIWFKLSKFKNIVFEIYASLFKINHFTSITVHVRSKYNTLT